MYVCLIYLLHGSICVLIYRGDILPNCLEDFDEEHIWLTILLCLDVWRRCPGCDGPLKTLC